MLPHGCCTDGPGSDDLATVRQIYLALAAVLSTAVAAISIFNVFYR
jgi:hypothetical protein